jgi:hypothetical protein
MAAPGIEPQRAAQSEWPADLHPQDFIAETRHHLRHRQNRTGWARVPIGVPHC